MESFGATTTPNSPTILFESPTSVTTQGTPQAIASGIKSSNVEIGLTAPGLAAAFASDFVRRGLPLRLRNILQSTTRSGRARHVRMVSSVSVLVYVCVRVCLS